MFTIGMMSPIELTPLKNIDNDLSLIGINRQVADELAQDRQRWRQLIHTVDAG